MVKKKKYIIYDFYDIYLRHARTKFSSIYIYKSQNSTNTYNTFEEMNSLPWLSLFCFCLSIFPLLASSTLLFQVFY